MRVLLSCDNCRASRVASCLPGCAPETGHIPECPLNDLDAALTCTAGGGCCAVQHNHGQAANACPGIGLNHHGAPCSHPNPLACLVVTPEGTECPGGHCGKGVDGCTVCRPITIMILDLGTPMSLTGA